RLNTDFIDNSAGVNSSDQEVNIKIALGEAVARGRLDLTRRNGILATAMNAFAMFGYWGLFTWISVHLCLPRRMMRVAARLAAETAGTLKLCLFSARLGAARCCTIAWSEGSQGPLPICP
ncbi:MAG: NAD-glutamate dehydrogenase, partial [Akkermansiaceae bacterium]|nr:NAD-glutamate dehydrogenase [Akkermansiaceae bacterium]